MTSSLQTDRRGPTLRDLVAPIFRHQRAGLLTAAAVVALTVLLMVLLPRHYVAEMRFLVKRDRADAILSGDPQMNVQSPAQVTEDELNSEVELLKSPALLEQVAVASGLTPASSDAPARARALRELQRALTITPLKQTRLIRVSYRDREPTRAVGVLHHLSQLYLERHLALHRPPGAQEFFGAQAEQFKEEMDGLQQQLKSFGRGADVVAADSEKESALAKLAEFDASLEQTRGVLAEATRRVADLDAQLAATPARETTSIRLSENLELVSELKSRILTLEVKRDEMARKFAPTYLPLVEVEQELDRARAALTRTEQAPVTERTSDQNPTHQWLRNELARVRTERAAAAARAAALTQTVRAYRLRARELDEKSATQQNLRRAFKTAEDNYLLYRRKQEEARISDALDRTRIANVVVADEPRPPSAPSDARRAWMLLVGIVMAAGTGVAATYLLDALNPRFRTPDEVEAILELPVLASLRATD